MADISTPVSLDGRSLTLTDLARVARDPRVEIQIAPAALERVSRSWRHVSSIASRYEQDYEQWRNGGAPPAFDYGVTTGFGSFKDTPIDPSDLLALQRNILLSHASGVGRNTNSEDLSNYFAPEIVRAALVIRLNAFLRGHSGVRTEMVEAIRKMLNCGIVALVPIRGSVGSSGDLCPLSHLFVLLLGIGRFYIVSSPEEMFSPQECPIREANEFYARVEIEPITPSYKEGLALTNGATFSAAMLALGVVDAEILANTADLGAAMSLEAVCGCARALDDKVHAARGHQGQIRSAENIRRLLAGSRLVEASGAVQDSYSLRCAPQVHGASRDAIAYASRVATTEINAATDNPLFFLGDDNKSENSFDHEFSENWPEAYSGFRRSSYSAGNFHGQPIALAADFLSIAIAELANISERRTQLLLDRNHNRRLPGNLVPNRGVSSGYMIAQYCSASLVSENKVLAHPASVDSIPTSGNIEDHVAMATNAARKLGSILFTSRAVLSIELVVATQAMDWRLALGVESASTVSEESAESRDGRFLGYLQSDDIELGLSMLGVGTGAAFRCIRRLVPTLREDREVSTEIEAVGSLVSYRAEAGGNSYLLKEVEENSGSNYSESDC